MATLYTQQSKNIRKLFLALVALIAIFATNHFLSYRGFTNNNNSLGYKEVDSNICPFQLTKNDVFQLILEDCVQVSQKGVAGAINNYFARTIKIKKLDNSLVQTFSNEMFEFEPGDTINAQIFHDDTESYVVLGQGTWVVWSFEIFSLKDQRRDNGSFINGALTSNGYFVFTSADGLKDAHPEVDQSNATNVVALNLSDFSRTLLFEGDAKINYSVAYNTKSYINSTKGNTVTIQKYLWDKKEVISKFNINVGDK